MTKAWLRQLVLALVLIGHSPYRAVVELLRDLFDRAYSLGTVHNIVTSAVEPARAISRGYRLGGVRIGPTMKSSRLAIQCSWGFVPPRPIATCSVERITGMQKPGACACWSWSIRASLPMPPSPTRAWVCAGQALALPGVPCQGPDASSIFFTKSRNSLAGNRALALCNLSNGISESLRSAQRYDGAGVPSQ